MQDLLRHWRDTPNVVWGVGYLGLVLLVLLLVGLIALFGNSPEEEEEASAETTVKEKTARERTASKREKTARESGASSGERTTTSKREEYTARPKPPVSNPEERIRYNLAAGLDFGDDPNEKVGVGEYENGCLYVRFNYSTPFDDSGIRGMPPVYYRAVYGDPELRERVCRVETNAYGTITDKYGQRTTELFLTTSMEADEARRINWDNSYSVDFEKIYTVEYLHPTVQANIEQEAAQQIIDCAHEGGLFDFDWLECP